MAGCLNGELEQGAAMAHGRQRSVEEEVVLFEMFNHGSEPSETASGCRHRAALGAAPVGASGTLRTAQAWQGRVRQGGCAQLRLGGCASRHAQRSGARRRPCAGMSGCLYMPSSWGNPGH